MKTSVALCTCNGEKHLQAQLDSYSAQVMAPDEIVICDDRSEDGTLEIIERFRRSASIPVKLVVNQQRLGVTANFAQAIALAKNDIIMLSDQDDVWAPNKVQVLRQIFEEEKVASLLHDAQLIDRDGDPLSSTLWNAKGPTPKERRQIKDGRGLDVLLRRNVVTGMCFSFLAKYREIVLPVPASWFHDGWIGMCMAIAVNIDLVDHPLASYRQHGAQIIGAAKPTAARELGTKTEGSIETWQLSLQRHQALLEATNGRMHASQTDVELIKGKIEHLERRMKILNRAPGSRSLWMQEIRNGHYKTYSFGLKSAAGDWLRPRL